MLKQVFNSINDNKISIIVDLIVNDMSESNIDSKLIKQNGDTLSQKDEKLVEMSNGCICCTLREDLLEEIQHLEKANKFDHLIIESTGISEPMPVAETFDFVDEDGFTLKDLAQLDTMVTVVDTYNFSKDFKSTEILTDEEFNRVPEFWETFESPFDIQVIQSEEEHGELTEVQ